MIDKSKQNAPPETDEVLREIRDVVVDIHEILKKNQVAKDGSTFIGNVGMHQHLNVPNIYINKEVVLEQLRISQTTLAKWRHKKWIKYVYRGSRMVVYSYVDLMEGLANNTITARGLNPFAAYKRMLEWYKKNVQDTETR